MDVPEKIVRAAAEALREKIPANPLLYRWEQDEVNEQIVRVVLAAAFAKLPECEEAQSTMNRPMNKDLYAEGYLDGWKSCLIKLAKWGQP